MDSSGLGARMEKEGATGRTNKIVRNPYHTGEKLREESRWWISKRKKFEIVSGLLSVWGVVGTKK